MLKKRILSFAFLAILMGGGCQDYGDRKTDCSIECDLEIMKGSISATVSLNEGGSIKGTPLNYAYGNNLIFQICGLSSGSNEPLCTERMPPNELEGCDQLKDPECVKSQITFSITVVSNALRKSGIKAELAIVKPFEIIDPDKLYVPDSSKLITPDGKTLRVGIASDSFSITDKKLLKDTPNISGMVPSLIERLGFTTGGKLISFRSYKEGTSKQGFSQYTIAAGTITQDLPSGYVLSTPLGVDPATGDFAQDRAVKLEVDNGLTLINCPLMAAGFSDCSNPDSSGYPNNRIPADIKAFALSPDANYAMISQVDGILRFASLPTQTSNPPALVWNPLSMQPGPMKTDRVLVAWGDLTGDGVVDLLALHQDATRQDVTVYRGSVSGMLQLSWDQGLSTTWGSALSGVMPIDAMALGDLDGDARADLAVGRGTQVSVWLNGASGGTAQAWSALVPVSADHKIRALAIGQVDGTGLKDLVVASSTTPDGTGMASQFIYAYLGQPQ